MGNSFDYAAITAVLEEEIVTYMGKSDRAGLSFVEACQYRDMASGVYWAWYSLAQKLPGFLSGQWSVDHDRLWAILFPLTVLHAEVQ